MFVTLFKRAPFLRLVLSLSAGITVQLHIYLNPLMVMTAAGLPGILLFIFPQLPLRIRYQYEWLRGMAIHLLIVCGGGLLVCLSDERRSGSYFEALIRSEDLLQVRVVEPLQQKARSYKTLGTIKYIIRGNIRIPATGKLLVYLSRDSAVRSLQYGDHLLIPSVLSPVSYSGNPGAFDYRQYCDNRQIYAQTFVHSGRWRRLPGKENNAFMNLVLQCRKYCLCIIQRCIGGREAGMAAALLIGYRYDLDREMLQEYTNTGIVHIIAISGMHLALIYGGLLWMLGWCPNRILPKSIKGAFIIFILWMFTFVTGGAASVLRATVMFTFITAGKFMLRRYTNTYNTLAASAFLLLCYEPRLLTDAGFQLSYLAVLSIVICYRRIYHLLQCGYGWLDKLWDMAALTLSAQVLTVPLCLYYFHRFPFFFLPANMLAVPLSTVILYAEILILFFGYVPWVGPVLGGLTQAMIRWMNNAVSWIGDCPYATIENLGIRLPTVICLYVCISGILICWLHKWRSGLLLVVVGWVIWSISNMCHRISEPYQRKMVIYNIPGHTVVDNIRGYRTVTIADPEVIKDDSLFERYIRLAHVLYNVKPSWQKRGGLQVIATGGKRLVVIDSTLPRISIRKKFRTDYLLLSHNPHLDIRQLEQIFTVGCYIFDASSRLRNIQQWKSDCYMLNLRFFSVPDQGAYVVNF